MEDIYGGVQGHYDRSVEEEWARLERHPIEFEMTTRFMRRYIRPGQRVLDVGGGPGRYTFYLTEYGCDVTLADLSPGNVAFARNRAKEVGAVFASHVANACDLEALGYPPESFDHVLLMGPLYHIQDEADRIRAVEGCLRLLKSGGCLFAAFISQYGGMLYDMKYGWECIIRPQLLAPMYEMLERNEPIVGETFTHTYFMPVDRVRPFFSGFDIEELHYAGIEAPIMPREPEFLQQPQEVRAAWLDLTEKLCERPELMGMAEHLLYIARKRPARGRDMACE